MAFVKSTSFSLVLLSMVLLALVASHVDASVFRAYGSPGCNGNTELLSLCGCSSIDMKYGYWFTYTGQPAALFDQPGCNGDPHSTFDSDSNACSPFGWQSIFIQC